MQPIRLAGINIGNILISVKKPATGYYVKPFHSTKHKGYAMIKMRQQEPITLIITLTLLLLLTAICPYDYLTWFLGVTPIFIAIPLLWWSAKNFQLTPLLYRLIFLHAIILMVGGHYTYAKVPLGFWIQDWFDLSRNHYDRIGHFMQGLEPAILAREILIRKNVVKQCGWLTLFVVSICLAFSACYELIEWFAAIASAEASQAFLGTQGDIWDTQWDMFMCLIGAISALLIFTRQHDSQLAALAKVTNKDGI